MKTLFRQYLRETVGWLWMMPAETRSDVTVQESMQCVSGQVQTHAAVGLVLLRP